MEGLSASKLPRMSKPAIRTAPLSSTQMNDARCSKKLRSRACVRACARENKSLGAFWPIMHTCYSQRGGQEEVPEGYEVDIITADVGNGVGRSIGVVDVELAAHCGALFGSVVDGNLRACRPTVHRLDAHTEYGSFVLLRSVDSRRLRQPAQLFPISRSPTEKRHRGNAIHSGIRRAANLRPSLELETEASWVAQGTFGLRPPGSKPSSEPCQSERVRRWSQLSRAFARHASRRQRPQRSHACGARLVHGPTLAPARAPPSCHHTLLFRRHSGEPATQGDNRRRGLKACILARMSRAVSPYAMMNRVLWVCQ